MTSKDVKNELTEEFSGIKYILTSGMRSRLLLAIYENPKKLDELRGELHKPSATILHGLKELEKRAQSDMKLAFSMYPTSISELFAVADEGKLMPPKSTWFEPKLRSGIFIHKI